MSASRRGQQMIKAVFTDADGTLLNDSHKVLPGTLKAIKALSERGIPFVVMSGRVPEGIYMIADEFGFGCCAAAFSGGLLLDEERKPFYSRTFSQKTAQDIMDFIKDRGLDCLCGIFSYDRLIVEDASLPAVKTECSIIKKVPEEGGLELLPKDQGVHKILGLCGEGKLDDIQAQVTAAFPDLCITRSTDTYLEVMPGGVNKGDAARQFCERFGIDPMDTAAFGDHYNDLPMLQAVGHPFLMGNAPESLKRELGVGDEGGASRATDLQLRASAAIPEGFLAPVTLTADCGSDGIAKALEGLGIL